MTDTMYGTGQLAVRGNLVILSAIHQPLCRKVMSNFKAMSDLVADAEELLSKLGRSASPEIRELGARVESSIGDMKGVFRDRLKQGEDTVRGATRTAARFARSNPMSSAVGLAVVGTVIYLLLSRNED